MAHWNEIRLDKSKRKTENFCDLGLLVFGEKYKFKQRFPPSPTPNGCCISLRGGLPPSLTSNLGLSGFQVYINI